MVIVGLVITIKWFAAEIAKRKVSYFSGVLLRDYVRHPNLSPYI
jgi:hypothetical protein